MRVYTDEGKSVSRLASAIDTLSPYDDVHAIMVLACDANEWALEQVSPILKKAPLPLFGGIFPALINDVHKMETGLIVVGLPYEANVVAVEGLSRPDVDFDAVIDDLLPPADPCRTMMVWVDGFAKRISAFIESLFNTFGLEMNYLGGGAGSLSMVSKPCLFTNQGVLQDSALLISLEAYSGIGVNHGWRSISGPYKITEVDRNRIITLDWAPAFDIYRQVVEQDCGLRFNDDNFFELASAYPFGIAKMGAERVVRDPVMTDDQGGLTCVGELPEGAFVDILNGGNASLIEAAGAAMEQAQQKFGTTHKAGATLFVDCISRVLFLKEQFNQELEAVKNPQWPMFGVCSLGEIANSGSDYLEFYNKTCVIGILGES